MKLRHTASIHTYNLYNGMRLDMFNYGFDEIDKISLF